MNGKIKNAFLEIHADENLKRQAYENVTTKKAKNHIPLGYKFAPIMVVFALFISYNMYFTPVSFISIDINPSIELSVNTFDRVIGVSASNEDGEEIINSVNLNNLNYVEALEVLDDTENFVDFTDNYAEITVISDNSDEIIASIENCDFNNQNMCFYSANIELKEQALENDISFGKYRAYLELLEVNSSVEIADIVNLPMKAIREMIDNNGILDEDMLPQRSGDGNPSGNGQNQGDGNNNRNQDGTQGNGGQNNDNQN